MDDADQGNVIYITIHIRSGEPAVDERVDITATTHTFCEPAMIGALRAIGADATADTFALLADAHSGLVTE